MLKLISTERVEELPDYTATVYECDETVTTKGDGLWGCEAGRAVRVTGISVIEYDDGYKTITVEHDSAWNIYTDSGFADAIGALLGCTVGFTEQGMQEDGMASMES